MYSVLQLKRGNKDSIFSLSQIKFIKHFARVSFRCLCHLYTELTTLFKEFLPDPGLGRESFKTFKTVRTFIPISQLNIYKVNPGFPDLHGVFAGDKRQVFSILQDKILTPKGYEHKGVQYHHYFTKAEWSINPVFVGVHGSPKCLLGALTSNFQFFIYCHNNVRCGNRRGKYKLRVNLTELYNKCLLAVWEEQRFSFEEYKRRVHELAIVDFSWISLWDEVKYDFLETPPSETGLITCHANGDLCIWKIKSAAIGEEFSVGLIFKSNIIPGEIVRCLKFHKLSQNLAILVIGTNSGIIRLYRIGRQYPEEPEADSPPQEVYFEYTIDNGTEIWERDMMQIDLIKIITTVDEENRLEKEQEGSVLKTAKRFDVVALKNHNHLISFTAWVAEKLNIVLEINHIQIPKSPIVGIVYQSDGNFVLCHELGATSVISVKNGLVSYYDESFQVFRIRQKFKYRLEKRRYKRYFYYGMDISPTRSMICVCRHLGNLFDHRLRMPGKVEFYSLLPHNDPVATWQVVKGIYEQCYNLNRIPDALQVLRFELKRFDRQNFEWYKTEELLKDMHVEDIQFYLWTLRALYRIDELRFHKLTKLGDPRIEFLMNNAIDLLSQIREVQDYLVECNCITLVEQLIKQPEHPIYDLNPLNIKSLTNIYSYLKAKDHEVLQNAPLLPQPVKSECVICSEPTEFQTNDKDITSGTILQKGFLWNELLCSRFHTERDICVLSLVPINEYPARICIYCRVSCFATPSFGQIPRCCLCGALMYMPPSIKEFSDEPKEVKDKTRGSTGDDQSQDGGDSGGDCHSDAGSENKSDSESGEGSGDQGDSDEDNDF